MSTEPTDADAEANTDSGMATAARVTELASDLGSTIEELDSYQRFAEAKRAVENDEEAQFDLEVQGTSVKEWIGLMLDGSTDWTSLID